MNLNASAFRARFSADVGQRFKKRDELRPAIRITAVIDRIRADEYVSGRNRFRPRQRVREKNCVSRRNVSGRNAASDFFFRPRFWNIDIVDQRGAGEDLIVDLNNAMFFRG